MKKTALYLLKIYKIFISPILHQALGVKHACRYLPTCSEFAIIHVKKDGIVIGGFKSLLRVLYCQPFAPSLPRFLKK
ncbi:MAG TPA: membrane protein insertion efficiency factor YidD [Patescibacteria group bacterium]